MINTTCVIANFNCTFQVNNEPKPLLDYFETIILPALTDRSLLRVAKKQKIVSANLFLYDVELIQLSNGEFALVGKHVKRAFLKIEQDITPEGGRVEIGQTIPSAPISSFILLLKNHRVIYFKEPNPGAPDIRSFNSTINTIIRKFISGKRKDLINTLKNSEFIYNDIKYNNMSDFTTNVLNIEYPRAEINIVPIESEELVKEKFDSISKINNIKLYIYNLNAESHYNDYFNSVGNFATSVGTPKVEQNFNNPEKLDEVKKMFSDAGGKIDYIVNAESENQEKIKLTPKDVTETIPIKYAEESDQKNKMQTVYNQLENKSEIKKINSEENFENYESKVPLFKKLISKFSL